MIQTVEDEFQSVASCSMQVIGQQCEVDTGDTGTCAVGTTTFRACVKTDQPLFRYAWAGPVIPPVVTPRVSSVRGILTPKAQSAPRPIITTAIAVKSVDESGPRVIAIPPLRTINREGISTSFTGSCFRPPGLLRTAADASNTNMSYVPSTEAVGQNGLSYDTAVDLEDLLPKVIQNYGNHLPGEAESSSHGDSHDKPIRGPNPSGSAAERTTSSASMNHAVSLSVRPELFHAVVRMIAMVEGGGLINRDGPEFDIAVADANYGMLINDSRRLVYTRQYGLQLLEFTE